MGTFVVQVNATDADAGKNGEVRFQFLTGGANLPDHQFFHIDDVTGNITVAKDIDREIQDDLYVRFYAFQNLVTALFLYCHLLCFAVHSAGVRSWRSAVG